MERLSRTEIGTVVSRCNWITFQKQGFVPYANFARDILDIDESISSESRTERARLIDKYGYDNVAEGSAFGYTDEGELLFRDPYDDPIYGIYIRGLGSE